MTNFLLKKAGLAFDKKKTGLALRKVTLALLMVIEFKTLSAKAKRKKVSSVLEGGLRLQACLDAEQLIRQDFEVEAYDMLRRLCNHLADRLGLVASEKECPSEIKDSVCSLIWATGKAEVPEGLTTVKAQLSLKYGKDFVNKAQENFDGCVNKTVSEKLLFQSDPSPELVDDYLSEIAEELDLAGAKKAVEPSPSTKPTAAPATATTIVDSATTTTTNSNGAPEQLSPKPVGVPPKENPEEETPEHTRKEAPEEETPKALTVVVLSPTKTETVTPMPKPEILPTTREDLVPKFESRVDKPEQHRVDKPEEARDHTVIKPAPLMKKPMNSSEVPSVVYL